MRRGGRNIGAVIGALALGLPMAGAAEELPPCHAAPPVEAGTAETGAETRVTIADAPLVDQAGKRVRFADVAGDRIVVANFVYTSCTTVCPVLSGVFTSLQERLGDQLGSKVQLVSVSIDPARDTPARLAEMAKRHKSGPAWRWLTGEKADVERVLRGFGTYVPDPAAHAPVVLVGDPRSGTWYRLNGFPTPEVLAGRVDQLLAARTAGAERAR